MSATCSGPPGQRRALTPRLRACGAVALLAAAGLAAAETAAPRGAPPAAAKATIVRVRQIEPQRVWRCSDAPAPAAGTRAPNDVAVAAAAGAIGAGAAANAGAAALGASATKGTAAAGGKASAATGAAPRGTTSAGAPAPAANAGPTAGGSRGTGSDPRAVATATAAAIIAADAIQPPPPGYPAAGAPQCAAVMLPPVTQWRVEYFLAGRYHQAWFDRPPGSDLTLAELRRATPAERP